MKIYLIDQTISKKKHIQLLLKSKEMKKFLKLSLYLFFFIFACLYLSFVYLRGHAPLVALQKSLSFLTVYSVALLLLFLIKLLWDFSFFGKYVDIHNAKVIDWKGKVITDRDIKSILFVGDNSMDIYYQTQADLFVQRIRFEHHQNEMLKSIAKIINSNSRIDILKKETFLDVVATPIQNL